MSWREPALGGAETSVPHAVIPAAVSAQKSASGRFMGEIL
jgi:hypothetical protein